MLVVGDLNTVHPRLPERPPELKPSVAYGFIVDSLGLVDTRPVPRPGDLTYDAEVNPYAGIWYNSWEGRQVFDYVLHRVPPGGSVELLERRRILDSEEPLSDHYGLLVLLRLVQGESEGT